MQSDRQLGAILVWQALPENACGLGLDEGVAATQPAKPSAMPGQNPHLPVAVPGAGRGIARVAALSGPGIASVEADCGPLCPQRLPAHADLDRATALIVDEGVLAALPLRLDLKRQALCQSMFGEDRQGVIGALVGQRPAQAVDIEALGRAHALVFDDDLGPALIHRPCARERRRRGGRRKRRDGEQPQAS